MFTIRINAKEKTRELDIEQKVASESSVIVCLCVFEYVWFFFNSVSHLHTIYDVKYMFWSTLQFQLNMLRYFVICVCARFDATLVICWRKREGYDDLKIKLKHQWYCLTSLSLSFELLQCLPLDSFLRLVYIRWHIKLVINFHSKSRSNIWEEGGIET